MAKRGPALWNFFGLLITLVVVSAAAPKTPDFEALDAQYRKDLGRLQEIERKIDRLNKLKEKTRTTVVFSAINGRLTLESGVAVSSSNQTSKTNLYFTNFNGNRVTLYNGSTWVVHTFSEITKALGTLSDATCYDVFLFNSSGVLTLDLVAWSSDTARATGLVLQDGIYVKSGAATHRYLGTLRTTSTTTTEDSTSKRFVWNYYNRQLRYMYVTDSTDSWTASSWDYANANSNNKVEYVMGVNEVLVDARSRIGGWNTTVYPGVGLSSGTVNSAQLSSYFAGLTNVGQPIYGMYAGYPGIGYRFLAWLVNGDGATVFGDAGSTMVVNGMLAHLEG